jgi:hypothetical protein
MLKLGLLPAASAVVIAGALTLFGPLALAQAATAGSVHPATAPVLGDDGNDNWGCVAAGSASCNGTPVNKPKPEPDPCPGGGMNTNIPGFDQVGKAGQATGKWLCQKAHGE